MIVLFPSKIKSNFQKILKIYQETINYGVLECPCCHSKEYILWGTYKRGVSYIKEQRVYSEVITIQRVRCKSCGHTHALLPFGIVPYKQLTDEVLILLLLDKFEDNIFSDDVVLKYKRQYLTHHYPHLSTMLQLTSAKDILNQLEKDKYNILSKYIKVHRKCFMQIKLGIIGLCPS